MLYSVQSLSTHFRYSEFRRATPIYGFAVIRQLDLPAELYTPQLQVRRALRGFDRIRPQVFVTS
jgi:hypothetical protein